MVKTIRALWHVVVPAIIVFGAPPSAAQAQRSFASPEQAAAALSAALKAGTEKMVVKVLGNPGKDIIISGDEVADSEMRRRFVSDYDTKHSIKAEGNKRATLVLGNDNTAFPIPLSNGSSGWEFDSKIGRHEILYRRIDRNEMDAIRTCLRYAQAQRAYAEKDRGLGAGVYAQRIISSPGKKDGLFWIDEHDPSPLDEFRTDAAREGYKFERQGAAPYHGYYYRTLKAQGPEAPGGTLSYMASGKMTGGFAFIAYPAEYGNSGVQTFMINQAGIVYQKDLGRFTYIYAERMSAFDPDHTWKKANPETSVRK